jgi:hydroxymethylbilane synthase
MIIIGTRGSDLAMRQADHIADLIGRHKTEIRIIKTKGDIIQDLSFDKMEGKAFFTKEIEEALIKKHIDIAVHSMKDLPTEPVKGLKIAAVIKREDPSDILLIRDNAYDKDNAIHLHGKAVVGTSSLRRSAQIKNIMNNLDVRPLRGNIPTRIQKLRDGNFDAIIIAKAGINRLKTDISDMKSFTLRPDIFLPCPSQGALALQIRSDDDKSKDILAGLNDKETEITVNAERSFLEHFGGGCHIPLGAYAYIENNIIHLTGSITSIDGNESVRDKLSGDDPVMLGEELANLLKSKGADKLL